MLTHRMHGIFTLVLLMSAGALAQTDTLVVRFIGNAGVHLTDGTTTLMVDVPYVSGAFGYMEYDPAALHAIGRVVSVITHRHDDHFDPKLFLRRTWEIIGPSEVTARLPAERVVAGDSVRVGNFSVRRFRTPHADTEHYSYLVSWGAKRLYFVGDTEDPSHMLSMPDLDILFVTPWLACAAEKTGKRPDTRRVVVYHHLTSEIPGLCGRPEAFGQNETVAIIVK